MDQDIKSYEQRPNIESIEYTLNVKPKVHEEYEDKLAILVCQIKIWNAKGHDWFNIPDASKCLTIRECESIEVADSAKDLINKAVVKFARGTVISLSSKKNSKVKIGDPGEETEYTTTLEEATNDGDLITPQTSTYSEDGVSTTSMAVNYDEKGLIDFNRTEEEPALLSPNDIAIGQRIEIRCGYAYSDKEFELMNTTDHKAGTSLNMDVVFTGFITSVSVNTPLELECTNMAHVLTCVSTPNISAGSTLTVKDFLDDNGTYHLLKGTGIELDESSKKSDITVMGGKISDNLTVADVLMAWADSGVNTMMQLQPDGTVKLKVGLAYSTGLGGNKLPNNDKKYITYKGKDNGKVNIIQFDWDVAEDKLTLKRNDKKYLAVKAIGHTDAYQTFSVTVRKNPDKEDEGWIIGDDQFQIINKREIKPRKKPKVVNGTKTKKKVDFKVKDKVPVDKYDVVTYVSPTKNITEAKLIEEAKQYWAQCSPNGISGSIDVFGDLIIRPTDIVGLLDLRQPEKNGYYYVESVSTKFGVNGYRRELKLPHKIASYKSVETI